MDNQQVRLTLLPVPFLNRYFVDALGNVYSDKRVNREIRKLKLIPHYGNTKKMYYRVKAANKLYLAHRLVASVLVGRELLSTEVINHINAITTDNRLVNLEITTHAGNVRHAVDNKLYCSGEEWHKCR